MRYKLTRKLVLNFTVVLVLFSMVVGGFFLMLFSQNTAQLHREELKTRAEAIARTMTTFVQGETVRRYGAYMRFIDDIAMSDVWVIDRALQVISVGTGGVLNYAELPENARQVTEKVFEMETTVSDSTHVISSNQSVVVGAPIFQPNGSVAAAVLLHSCVDSQNEATLAGIQILMWSMLLALLLGVLLSVYMAKRFVSPLQKMAQVVAYLAEGDYTAHTRIDGSDEIANLAHNVDILADKLYEASQQSSQLEQMRRDYISNISHELRTPVTVIRGSLEALCDGVVTNTEKIDEYHSQMLAESIHLERLVNDLLELSRLQNADFSLEMSQINLVGVLEDAVRSVRQLAAVKSIHVNYDCKVWEYTMQGDYGRLRQMFIVVLQNAIKFSDENSRVDVKVWKQDGAVKISVVDYGIGIQPNDLDHIFERFYKSTDGKNRKGTGLGLAIAKQIADRHRIGLGVTSEPQVRTEFTFVAK